MGKNIIYACSLSGYFIYAIINNLILLSIHKAVGESFKPYTYGFICTPLEKFTMPYKLELVWLSLLFFYLLCNYLAVKFSKNIYFKSFCVGIYFSFLFQSFIYSILLVTDLFKKNKLSDAYFFASNFQELSSKFFGLHFVLPMLLGLFGFYLLSNYKKDIHFNPKLVFYFTVVSFIIGEALMFLIDK
jgi:hypothetical protein